MTEASHKRSIVVWNLPPAVACGKTFTIRLGIKCEGHCRPQDWRLEVRDHEGVSLGRVAVGENRWPGTEGLHGAEIELRAPGSEGLYAFAVVAPALEAAPDGRGHAEASAAFKVRVVPDAECRLTVIAIERESRAPVSGARVVVHPYRALTDESGTAELELPRGRYRLFVSGRDFFPIRLDGELTADTTIRAELEPDLGPNDAELWS